MFGFCSKRLQALVPICKIVGDSGICLCIFQSSKLSQKFFSSNTPLSLAADKYKPQEQENSFKVSYLIKSCGLTPEIALSVSQRIKFETSEKPDLVLGLLKDHGFTNTHISRLVKVCPTLLLVNAEKTLLPKLDFYRSIGLSGVDLARVVIWNPCLLTRSLEKCIIPCYDILKSVLILDEKVAKFFGRSSWILLDNVLKNFAVNVSILRALGVPQSFISVLITCHPYVACRETSMFEKDVEKVVNMGFNPLKMIFITALHVISCVGESSWAQKREIYTQCGWTENDFLTAFRKDPMFMALSKKNFSSKMDVFVNKMGLQPADVARVPSILKYSLERRIIPRCSVIKVLLSKGLMKEKPALSYVLIEPDEAFMNRFVKRHQENVPLLLDIFHGKSSFL